MNERASEHRRNDSLEGLLNEIQDLLAPAESRLMAEHTQPKWPVVLVVGSCRSGTTLVMQWLAATKQFAYPTNLLSRFYGAPAVGARIQMLLTDPRFNFRDELADLSDEFSFDSDLGKTKGALSPNEYWYFWRRFIPNERPRHLEGDEVAQIDGAGFAADLAAVEHAFDKPFAMKGIILQYNIPAIAAMLDKVVFVYVRRHPFYNAQSLLEAREEFFGDRTGWYSGRPKEYAELAEMDPLAQVAGQVHYTDVAIREGFATLPESQHMTLDYEAFCDTPEPFYHALRDRLAQQDRDIDGDYLAPNRFDHLNELRLSQADADALCKYYEEFSGSPLRP